MCDKAADICVNTKQQETFKALMSFAKRILIKTLISIYKHKLK